jgi:hypothetical protein
MELNVQKKNIRTIEELNSRLKRSNNKIDSKTQITPEKTSGLFFAFYFFDQNVVFFDSKTNIRVKYFPHFLLFFAPLFCYSQEVVSSGGEQFSNAEGSFTFTIGEPVIETISNTSNTLTQGFQQNYEAILSTSSIPQLNGISVYPNPFIDMITVNFSDAVLDNMSITLQELNGKIIMESKFPKTYANNTFDLILSDLSDGVYFLTITISVESSATYRVVKNH